MSDKQKNNSNPIKEIDSLSFELSILIDHLFTVVDFKRSFGDRKVIIEILKDTNLKIYRVISENLGKKLI